MPFDYLRSLLEKAGQNIDKSGQMMKQQTDLSGKIAENPEYVPTPDEADKQKEYFKQTAAAVAGSVAPVEGAAEGLLGKLAKKIAPEAAEEGAENMAQQASAAKSVQNQVSDLAEQGSKKVSQDDLRAATSDLSRKLDAQSRLEDYRKMRRGF